VYDELGLERCYRATKGHPYYVLKALEPHLGELPGWAAEHLGSFIQAVEDAVRDPAAAKRFDAGRALGFVRMGRGTRLSDVRRLRLAHLVHRDVQMAVLGEAWEPWSSDKAWTPENLRKQREQLLADRTGKRTALPVPKSASMGFRWKTSGLKVVRRRPTAAVSPKKAREDVAIKYQIDEHTVRRLLETMPKLRKLAEGRSPKRARRSRRKNPEVGRD
jgi:hypothetical protein